jgi:hypothetical protein
MCTFAPPQRLLPGVLAVVGTSRYIGVLFWLAVALLQGSHASYYFFAFNRRRRQQRHRPQRVGEVVIRFVLSFRLTQRGINERTT